MQQSSETSVPNRRKEDRIELLTFQEVAGTCRASVATVKYWVAMGKMRVVKLGKHPLIEKEELIRFIGTAKTAN